ncbi:hypothetical protein BIWAKO_07043 [Bosea sp. BIWAKO-01]|nr:hypothetical protein BIWAKO_07043 [Bosea sp. BIWAKO-01]
MKDIPRHMQIDYHFIGTMRSRDRHDVIRNIPGRSERETAAPLQ